MRQGLSATGMRAWPLHLVFGALLVGSLTAQQRTADTLVEIDPGRPLGGGDARCAVAGSDIP